MKRLFMCISVAFLAAQTNPAGAQTPEKPAPPFTLTISELHGVFGPSLDRLYVEVKNICNEKLVEPGCVETTGYFTVTVLYNGSPLEEKDAAARHRSETQQAQNCTLTLGNIGIEPGDSRMHWVSLAAKYDVSRPGTYEVTVSRETDPDHPDKSVMVKSNTLTVIVPNAGADATQ